MKRIVLCFLVMSLVLGACAAQTGEGVPGRLSRDLFSQALYSRIADDWAAYMELSEFEKMASSTTPGWGKAEFDDWVAAEEFVGFTIPNPAEEQAGLEKGTYVGMPLGFMGAPRVEVSWHSTAEGDVESLTMIGGYRTGDIRIMVTVRLKAELPEDTLSDTVISEDSGEAYSAVQAELMKGCAEYCIRVIGENGIREELYPVLEMILPAFEEIPVI